MGSTKHINIKYELMRSIEDLSMRGLYQSCKWSCEQINGLPNDVIRDTSASPSTTNNNSISSFTHYGDEEHLKYLLAKSYFDLKEYKRCADVLVNCTHNVNLFLRYYSTYLSCEKSFYQQSIELQALAASKEIRNNEEQANKQNNNTNNNNGNNSNGNTNSVKDESMNQVNNMLQASHHKSISKELQQLYQHLNKLYNGNSNNSNQQQQIIQQTFKKDGLLLYIYGMVLKRKGDNVMARQVLVESVNIYPCNWSAWLDLASLCNDFNSVQQLGGINDHFMKDFFLAHIRLELQQNNEGIQIYQKLTNQFPNSNYILAQNAIANYNLRAYDIGEELFDKLLEREPNRLENIDIYSNILYVRDKKVNLSMLAHRAMTTEKYCPETCCIIGNYYSLKSEHEKAILYFQRALKLNDNYLEAWTLIGHEYLEIKNVSNAINAYRRAIDVNTKDYRAWYGLGQTYQLLKLPLYSLYYFKKATTLRPYDPRMWCAVAGCYELLERVADAIRCYERAEENFDRERVALSKLAKLYQELQNHEKAAYYFKKNLYHRDHEKIDGQETIDSLLFLSNYHMNNKQYEEAEKYCMRLLDYAGPEKEEAKSLLKDIHSIHKSIKK